MEPYEIIIGDILMEQNTNRMWWTIGLIVLGSLLLGGFVVIANTNVMPQVKEKMTALFASPSNTNKINPDDAKWITKGDWGSNGKFVVDKDGNAVIYAIDASKPIMFHDMEYENRKLAKDTLSTLTFQDKVKGDTNSSMNSVFGNTYTNLKTVNNLDTNVDTSNVTYMSRIFYGSKLTSVDDLSQWDTSKVIYMNQMFYGSELTSVDLSKWDTSNVTDMSSMFQSSKLTSVGDLSKWNTSKVTNMGNMFTGSTLTRPSWYH